MSVGGDHEHGSAVPGVRFVGNDSDVDVTHDRPGVAKLPAAEAR